VTSSAAKVVLSIIRQTGAGRPNTASPKRLCNQIEDGRLRALVVDAGVNHGVRRAAKWLQRAAGVEEDGIVGPRTLAAVNVIARS